LVLAATAVRIGTPELWQARADAVLERGMAAVADTVIDRFFSEGFRRERTEEVARFRTLLELTAPEAYAAACGCLRDADLGEEVAAIRAPTLIAVGTEDVATPPPEAEELHRRIPASELVTFEGAGHLLSVESPEAFARSVLGFVEIDI
jgi:pimeloyl-ACP methyl ester carboxylesterase